MAVFYGAAGHGYVSFPSAVAPFFRLFYCEVRETLLPQFERSTMLLKILGLGWCEYKKVNTVAMPSQILVMFEVDFGY